VSGNTVTLKSVGTTTITASQAGNSDWNAAANVLQTLTVQARDTDGDGVTDSKELADGTNPNSANSFNPLSKGLVAYYPFSGNANDESGNGRHGIPQNTLLVTDRNGQLNGAYTFNKTSARIVADYTGWPGGNSDRTVSLWVKCDSIMHGNLFTFGGGTQTRVNTRFSLLLASDGVAFIGESNDSDKYWPGDLNGAGWHQLAITWLSGVGRIFLDGTVLGEFSKTLNTDGSMPFVIGSNSLIRNDEFFEGLLDEVRVYDRALSHAEIGQLYANEAGNLDSDGDGLTDAWERGYGRYQIILGNFTWEQAKADAEMRGGHLATITSEAEWNSIASSLSAELLAAARSDLDRKCQRQSADLEGPNLHRTAEPAEPVGKRSASLELGCYQVECPDCADAQPQ
jgi:hypothetical protein